MAQGLECIDLSGEDAPEHTATTPKAATLSTSDDCIKREESVTLDLASNGGMDVDELEYCDEPGCIEAFPLTAYTKRGVLGGYLCEKCGPHDKLQRQRFRQARDTADSGTAGLSQLRLGSVDTNKHASATAIGSGRTTRLGKIESCDNSACGTDFKLTIHNKKGHWGGWLCDDCSEDTTITSDGTAQGERTALSSRTSPASPTDDDELNLGGDAFYERLSQTQRSSAFGGKTSNSNGASTSGSPVSEESLFCTPPPSMKRAKAVCWQKGTTGDQHIQSGRKRKFKPLSDFRGRNATTFDKATLDAMPDRPRKRQAAAGVPEHIGAPLSPPELSRYSSDLRTAPSDRPQGQLPDSVIAELCRLPLLFRHVQTLAESMIALKRDNDQLRAKLCKIEEDQKGISDHVDRSMQAMTEQTRVSIKQINDKCQELIDNGDDVVVAATGTSQRPVVAGGAYGGPRFGPSPKRSTYGLDAKSIKEKRAKMQQERAARNAFGSSFG